MLGIQYNPEPPRVWSRVQRRCTSTIESSPFVYVPLQTKTILYENAIYNEKQYYKGNILQYKGNSSRLTKNQQYSQIVNGFGSSRKKSYATQTETYTNPNTTGLLRINYTEIPFPNTLVGKPNNISGPYQYNITNPNNCNTTSLQDGGTLICNAYADPCTGKIIKKTEQQICFPTYCSDVPGQIQNLCWNPKINTFFPRQTLTMNNSGSKWPEGYKEFVSAINLSPPVLVLVYSNTTSLQLSWSINYCKIMPVTSFKIYINNVLYKIIPNANLYTITINITNKSSFTITSLSGKYESNKSNIITYDPNTTGNSTTDDPFIDPGVGDTITYTCKQYNDIMQNNTIIQISTYLLHYISNINNVNDTTTVSLDTLNNLNVELIKLKNSLNVNSCYLNIIPIFTNILYSVKNGYDLKHDLKSANLNMIDYRHNSEILLNTDLLQKYLTELSTQQRFAELNITATSATLKPKYKKYHELYDIPENLNYDPVKLLFVESLL